MLNWIFQRKPNFWIPRKFIYSPVYFELDETQPHFLSWQYGFVRCVWVRALWLRLLSTFYSFQCGVNIVQNYFDYYSLSLHPSRCSVGDRLRCKDCEWDCLQYKVVINVLDTPIEMPQHIISIRIHTSSMISITITASWERNGTVYDPGVKWIRKFTFNDPKLINLRHNLINIERWRCESASASNHQILVMR